MISGRATRRHLVYVLAVLPAACAPLPRAVRAPRVYRLAPEFAFAPEHPRRSWSLAISEPLAERALDTDRIAVVRRGFELLYFQGVVWSDRVPVMLQLLMVQAFLAAQALPAVGTDRDGFRPDYLLRPILHAFQVRENGPADRTAEVALSVTLLRMPRRTIVGTRNIAAEVKVAGPALGGVVQAFDRALARVLRELVDWTLEMGETDWQRRQTPPNLL